MPAGPCGSGLWKWQQGAEEGPQRPLSRCVWLLGGGGWWWEPLDKNWEGAFGGTEITGARMFVAGGCLGQGFTWMSPGKAQTEPPLFRPECLPVLKLPQSALNFEWEEWGGVQTAPGHLPVAVGALWVLMLQEETWGVEGDIPLAAGASLVCPGLSFRISSAWGCYNQIWCLLGILAGAERQEEIPVSTPSHSSQEQTSISPCLLISLSKTPCPAHSFASVPSAVSQR